MLEIFTLQNLVLFIAGTVNLLMSIFIFSRGNSKKINKYFSYLTFFNFTWILGIILAYYFDNINLVSFYDRTTNMSGIGIIISLFYFSLHFPYQREEINKVKTTIIWLFTILLSIVIYTKWFIVSTVWIGNSSDYISRYYKPVFILYAAYFVALAIWSIYLLFVKYKHAEGLAKKQLKWLILTISIGLFGGAYFNILLNYLGEFRLGWLGPIFTLLMNIVVFYFITSAKDKING